jgi:hypothetical protein
MYCRNESGLVLKMKGIRAAKRVLVATNSALLSLSPFESCFAELSLGLHGRERVGKTVCSI